MQTRLPAIVLLALALAAGIVQAEALTILHTNDTHGHLLPFSYPGVVAAGSAVEGLSDRSDIGGIARRATLVKEIRAQLSSKGTTVWFVDAGDYCDGTPFSTEYHGDADVAAMSAAGYDFATLGNHEFNNTLDQVRKMVAEARYPILVANAVERETGKPLARPYAVETVGAARVALFGLVTGEAASYPAAREGVDIEDPIAAARRIASELDGMADILICLSHCGNDVDEDLARAVPEIDLIVGGHSHSRLPSGEIVWRSEDLLENDVNGTIIVQAHQWGGELGRVDLRFARRQDGKWAVDRYRARLVPITGAIAPDPAVAETVDRYWSPIAPRYGEVIGTAAGDFSSRGDDRAEYNLVADAIREELGVEFDFENLGGVRSPLVAGPITMADIVTLDPFQNNVVTFRATGAQIRAILLRYKPAVAGIRYRIEDGEMREATIGGAPLEDGKTYAGATNSYFAGFALKGIETTDTGRSRRETIIEHVRRKGTVHPSYDGRRVVLGGRGGDD